MYLYDLTLNLAVTEKQCLHNRYSFVTPFVTVLLQFLWKRLGKNLANMLTEFSKIPDVIANKNWQKQYSI